MVTAARTAIWDALSHYHLANNDHSDAGGKRRLAADSEVRSTDKGRHLPIILTQNAKYLSRIIKR